MRNIRAILVPLLLLAALVALALCTLQFDKVAHFDFIWDVLLGILLGAGLSLLPSMAGFGARKNALTSLFWVCGFAALLLIFYQYLSMVTGIKLDYLTFLAAPEPRLRIVEGAVLGYCSVTAGRAKV